MAVKRYEELDFADDFMFWKVMTEYEEICKKVVELCIGEKVRTIRYKQGQKEMKIFADTRGIRLDVFLEDDANTLYDFEMQRVRKPGIGKRIRYYDSVMTVNALEAGIDYNELPNSYIVFICLFDPFGEGRAVYVFRRREKENPDLTLKDGAVDILINASGNTYECSEEMQNFLDTVRGQSVKDGIGKQIQEAVEQIKAREEWRVEYMLYEIRMKESREEGFAEGVEQGKIEGREEGRESTLIENVKNVMNTFDISPDQALDSLKVQGEEREKILQML